MLMCPIIMLNMSNTDKQQNRSANQFFSQVANQEIVLEIMTKDLWKGSGRLPHHPAKGSGKGKSPRSPNQAHSITTSSYTSDPTSTSHSEAYGGPSNFLAPRGPSNDALTKTTFYSPASQNSGVPLAPPSNTLAGFSQFNRQGSDSSAIGKDFSFGNSSPKTG